MNILKIFLLAGLIILLGCQQQESPTQITEQNNQQMREPLAKPVDNPGSEVIRSKISPWHFWFLDAEKCLLSLHVAYEDYCEAGTEAVELYQQIVAHPEHQGILEMQLLKSKDHPLFIFDWSDDGGCLPPGQLYTPDGFNCVLLGERLIASGTGQLVYNDNDIYHWLENDRMRTNTFGARGQGKLTDSEGNTYHYNAIYKQSWALNKDNFYYKETINFQMTGQ